MQVEMLQGWDDFFVAQAGAAAALVGLLFVAVSINLERILKYSHLPTRALEVLVMLLCLLVISTWSLVPRQSNVAYGVEIAVTGLLTWFILTRALISTRHSGYERAVRIFMNQAPPLPFVIGGALIALGFPGGIYWLVPGTLLSLVCSAACAWILLVEIQR